MICANTLWSLMSFALSLMHNLMRDILLLKSPQDAVIPFQILGGEAQVVQVYALLSQSL